MYPVWTLLQTSSFEICTSAHLSFTKSSKVCEHEGVVDGGGGDEDVLLDGFVLVPEQGGGGG